MSESFCFKRRVNFYETDVMGVVHHSNYLRYFEEARMDWLRNSGLSEFHAPHYPFTLAVIETQCRHQRPAYLDDELHIYLQLRLEGLKFRFRYAIFSPRFKEPLATGMSLHVGVDESFRVCRPPQAMKTKVENEIWTETWPSNS